MAAEKEIFECQGCGFCCHGETTVSLDAADRQRMMAYLHLNRDEIGRKYWRQTGPVVQMQIVDGHCVFYDRGCTIHPGKPWRCSQWPLHPSILKDRANFETIKASCPGINRHLSYEKFCAILTELIQDRGRMPG